MSNDPLADGRSSIAGRNARYGIWFFLIYCVLYAGYMGLTTFAFKAMAAPVMGVNWAIVYGMGLIVAALVLAILYMMVCTTGGEHQDTIDSAADAAKNSGDSK